MRDYVKYLEKVLEELLKLPSDQFNKKMDELSHQLTKQFLERTAWSDEPVKHCYPTPSTYMKLVKELENGNK